MLTTLKKAQTCVSQGQFKQAELLYREVLKTDATNGHAFLGLGKLAIQLYQYDQAINLLIKACHYLPTSTTALIHLAEAFNAVCSEQDALSTLCYAQTTFPHSAQVHYQLAQQYLMTGDIELAEHCLRQVIANDSGTLSAYAVYELVRCHRHSPADEQLLHQQLIQSHVTQPQQTVIHYALANIAHQVLNHDLAWQHFSAANALQLKACTFKTAELAPFFQSIKQLSTNGLIPVSSPTESEIRPIFIVGLPRSGSTLLEQMLARLPAVSAGGELPYLSREVDHYLSQQTGNHYPFTLQNLTQEQKQQAADIYLNALKKHARHLPIVIDKLPANFQSIGLIYSLFPQAKVIHIKRQPEAVAFSIFRNDFAQNEPYFCSLSECKTYFELYQDLMAHWHQQLPGFVFDVEYEQLIENTQQTMQDLLAFCEIDWDNACLGETKISTPITTLSNIDARQPIMQTIKNDWLPYEKHVRAFSQPNSVGRKVNNE